MPPFRLTARSEKYSVAPRDYQFALSVEAWPGVGLTPLKPMGMMFPICGFGRPDWTLICLSHPTNSSVRVASDGFWVEGRWVKKTWNLGEGLSD